MALVMFTIDAEYEVGRRRIPNEEVAEEAMKNADVMISVCQHRPAQRKNGSKRGKAVN
jgi:hypothetical protein